jgi:glycosyltransferase involved in cell wall biosynthesis
LNATPSLKNPIDLSIVMPCLNEAETLAICIHKAQAALSASGLEGEVVIADNGSTDGSQEIALREGARLIEVAAKGYGNALRGGIRAARGRWVLMGDADDSYDFSAIKPFVEALMNGADLVMGCRMPSGGGRILPGAMPWKHRWIGNPILTFIGRLFFGCPSHDFHCGMRAFSKRSFDSLNISTTGMEFASEVVIKATLAGWRISEVPITLHPDGRSRPPHLRSWRDGWRHLRFMLLFSPRWLFLHPGLLLSSIGLSLLVILSAGQVRISTVTLDAGSMMAGAMLLFVGLQLGWFAVFTRAFAVAEGLLPPHARLKRILGTLTLEWGLLLGLAIMIGGATLFLRAFLDWRGAGFYGLPYSENLRRIILACSMVVIGIQWMFGSFFLGILNLKTGRSISEGSNEQSTATERHQ